LADAYSWNILKYSFFPSVIIFFEKIIFLKFRHSILELFSTNPALLVFAKSWMSPTNPPNPLLVLLIWLAICFSCIHQSNWTLNIMSVSQDSKLLFSIGIVQNSQIMNYYKILMFLLGTFSWGHGHTVWRKEWKISPYIQCIQVFLVPNIARFMQRLLRPFPMNEYATFILYRRTLYWQEHKNNCAQMTTMKLGANVGISKPRACHFDIKLTSKL
jgi:hypothetical protein